MGLARSARVTALVLPLVALGAAPAGAKPEMGLALSANEGVMVSRVVQNVASGNVDTTIMDYLAVSGSLSTGPLVLGIDVDGAFALFGRLDVFAGGFVGGQLRSARTLFQITAEGGGHLVANAGQDSSHNSDVKQVTLPYLGGRLRVGHGLRTRKGTMFLGASAFVREDVKRERVTASIAPTCAFLDFECQPQGVSTLLDVGGTTVGLAFDFTWWSAGWFRPPAGASD